MLGHVQKPQLLVGRTALDERAGRYPEHVCNIAEGDVSIGWNTL
jgi:hypothetical protein